MKNLIALLVFTSCLSLHTNAQKTTEIKSQPIIDVIEVNGKFRQNLTFEQFLKKDSRFRDQNTLFYPGTTRRLFPYQRSVPRTQIYGAYRTFIMGGVDINANAKSVKNFVNNPEAYMVNVPIAATGVNRIYIEGENTMSGSFKNLKQLKMKDIKTIAVVNKLNDRNIYIELMENSKEIFLN